MRRRRPLEPSRGPHGLHSILGELFIYYVLIAVGGGVFTAFMAMLFEAIGIGPESFFGWVVPCGAAGAVLVAS